MGDYASSVSTDPKDEAPGDAALLHLLDGYYIKRHSVKAWNTSGGYCDVFTGDHPIFGKVALKRPRGDQCTDKQLESFKREAHIWKGLDHPNILQFVGLIDTPSDVWLVSIFAANGTLHKYISSHQEADRHRLVLQFTSGLAYLHSRKVVHGDLKSDNLLISAKHQLLIADFGLSKLNGMSTNTSKKGAGSVRWMAPELLEGEEEEAIKTSLSDVYAYGITISEILSGELPFKQYTSAIFVIKAVLKNKRPPIPEELVRGTPYAILWAVAKDCWIAEPSKRPTLDDICRRFSLDYTKPVGRAIRSGALRPNETNSESASTEVISTSPGNATLNQDVDFNPQSVNPTIQPSDLSDNHLLRLLGNAEYGDIGHMLDDGLCLEGTRVEILGRLDAWVADYQSSPRIMLLKGQAGRGKSTIARSVLLRYRKHWRDSASSAIFHFRRGNEGLNSRLLLALARQLGSSANVKVRTAILNSIQDHEDIAQLRLEEQFVVLLVDPLKELRANSPRILLVIDALDECSDHSLISALFRLIRKHAPSVPRTVKFLLTTRPEEHIVSPFKALPDSTQEDLDDVDLALIDRDVRSYFTNRLSEIQQDFGFDSNWVPPKAINELVSLSQGLFQWAHVAMEYVRERPRLNLRRLVGSPTNLLGLPTLYKQILSTAFPLRKDIKEDRNFLALIQHVIGSLIIAHRPMSPAALEYLWDNIPGCPPISHPGIEIRDGILGRLGSILILPGTPEGSVHFMHGSVRDFFMDPAQCEDQRFLIDPAVHHMRLALICFDRMKDLNQSSHGINGMSDLATKVVDVTEQHRYLSHGLQYCSRSSSTHLSEARDDELRSFDKVQAELEEFCSKQLPYWIECLSLTGVLSEAFDMIRRASKWLEDNNSSQSFVGIPAITLFSDANDLCRQFFKHMSTYPRHIALPYLLQFPSETALQAAYADTIEPRAPRIVRGPALRQDWSRVVLGGSVVSCVVFSPDGKILAAGLLNNMIQLWNMDTGEPMELPLIGHHGQVNALAFSPDNKTLASGSDDMTIRLWSVDTGEPKRMPLVGHTGRVTGVAYSPGGNTLASCSSDSTLRLWNIDCNEEPTGKLLLGHEDGVTSVAYLPDGKTIASGSSHATIRWTIDSHTGKPMGAARNQHSNYVMCFAFSPDGKRLAAGLVNNMIQLWNMHTGEPIGSPLVDHEGQVSGLAFSPDSKTLASGSNDTTVRLWDVDYGAIKGTTLSGHKYSVRSVAWSPDGKTVASGSHDSTVRLWDIGTGAGKSKALSLVGHNERITSVAYFLDTKTLASGSVDQIRLWDIDTGKPMGTPLVGHEARAEARVTSTALSSDCKILASKLDDHRIRVWNVDTGALIIKFPDAHKNHISSVDYSLGSNILTVGLDNGLIWLWTVASGQRQRPRWALAGHEAQARSVAYSVDGKTFASESANNRIKLWDMDTGKQRGKPLVGHKARVTSFAFSSDGKILASGSEDQSIWLWDINTGKPQAESPADVNDRLKNPIYSLAFSPGEKTLASGSDDGTIRLYKIGATRPQSEKFAFKLYDEKAKLWSIVLRGEQHAARAISLAFSPDGRILASGSDNHTIRLWNVNTRKLLGVPLAGHRKFISSLAFSSDGTTIASGSVDGTIHLWTIATGKQEGLSLSGSHGYVARVAFSLDGQTLESYHNFGSSYEIIHWRLGYGGMAMSIKVADDKDSNANLKGPDANLQENDIGLQEPGADLKTSDADRKDGALLHASDIQLDIDSTEAHERGWVFVGGRRCFWLPPEFYLDRDNHKVEMSLFENHFLVLHHPNIHILDISAFL